MNSTTAPAKRVGKNPWFQSGFLIAVFILGVSAVGLNLAVSALQLHFKKARVELKEELATVPAQMGHWMQVSKDEPLDHEMQDQLQTDKYIFRDYVDTRVLSKADIASFEGLGSGERKNRVALIQQSHPEAVLSMAVTYYTGGADTVAHIPERCYVADGYLPSTHETLTWNLTGPDAVDPSAAPGTSPAPVAPTVAATAPHPLEIRFINFEDQTGAGRVTKRVAYFFYVDGQFESDNLAVRARLQDLRTKHGFYSKVELASIIPDHDQCARTMTDFLSQAMPEIEKCYPDWNSIEGPGVKK